MSGQPQVTRPRPSWAWINEWRYRGRTDVHGFRSIEVRALFSNNEAPELGGRPNEFVVIYAHGENRSEATVRMNRAAAAKLVEQLQAALEWDGQ